jgi:hypothetical protein
MSRARNMCICQLPRLKSRKFRVYVAAKTKICNKRNAAPLRTHSHSPGRSADLFQLPSGSPAHRPSPSGITNHARHGPAEPLPRIHRWLRICKSEQACAAAACARGPALRYSNALTTDDARRTKLALHTRCHTLETTINSIDFSPRIAWASAALLTNIVMVMMTAAL